MDPTIAAAGEVSPRRVFRNRPGRNNYLKVNLDESTIKRLYQIMRQLYDELKAPAAQQDMRSVNVASGSASVQKSLSIKVRSPKSLHMTLLFGGETFAELSPGELQDFYSGVAMEMNRRGLMQGDGDYNDVISSHFKSKSNNDNAMSVLPVTRASSFTIQELCLFPPRRNNLIVAMLVAPREWMQLYDSLRNVALCSSSPLLKELASDYNKPMWLPHVTLANVHGGTSADRDALRRKLKQVSDELHGLQATPFGVSLGGPVPEQVKLDWEFNIRAT
ncbi:hypothetical protein MPSEU_000828000 [Mayamaea pseudoterrestris]|nr:hypothetical protein MPSEU_000828000 [Mayamaea pseudoterrestris]